MRGEVEGGRGEGGERIQLEGGERKVSIRGLGMSSSYSQMSRLLVRGKERDSLLLDLSLLAHNLRIAH